MLGIFTLVLMIPGTQVSGLSLSESRRPPPTSNSIPTLVLNIPKTKDECVFVKKIKPKMRFTFSCDQPPGVPCPAQTCRETFSLHFINMEPYSGPMFRNILNETIKECCWMKNINPHLEYIPAQNLSSIVRQNLDHSTVVKHAEDDRPTHFIFPVLGDKKATRMHGHYFIPLFKPPGAFYITLKHGINMGYLIEQCVGQWPLLLICIVMASIAGFIAWLCETRKNTDEFPRQFFRGWFEGTWWSFISMTTVGYGDKTPRSIAGRCFSVAWILAGIIVFNILAGELTSVIMEAKTHVVSMVDQKVGTLDRMYENSLVVEHGGILVTTDSKDSNETQKFYSLMKNLQLSKIDGVLLDKLAYRSFKDNMLREMEDKNIVDFFLHKTVLTDIQHSGEDVSYGVLIKYEKRYDYFKPMLESNRIAFKATISQYLNGVARNSSSRQRSDVKHENIHLEAFSNLQLGYFFIPVGIILLFGILFEVLRRKKNSSIQDTTQETRHEIIC